MAVPDDLVNKARKAGGPMNEIIETMALLGQIGREKVLKLYGESMPPEIGAARRELGILGGQRMVERSMEENEEMMK